jgi:cell division septation protein DedD
MTSEIRRFQDSDEDAFHEIQLSGKQLVFLCMATTLVSIVIFLCGVLVGRGVKPGEPVAEAVVTSAAAPAEAPPEMALQDASAKATDGPPVDTPTPEAVKGDAQAAAGTPPLVVSDQAQPAKSEPTKSQGTLPERMPAQSTAAAPTPTSTADPASKVGARGLRGAVNSEVTPAPANVAAGRIPPESGPAQAASTETGLPGAGGAPVAKAEPPDPEPDTVPEAETPPASHASPAGGAMSTIAVQVAALSNKSDAEAVARRLSEKGYSAYVVTPEPGTRAIFKVRVGDYGTAAEAERVSRRLRQEEKFQPWVIR